MNILGVDYGTKRVGLAIGDSSSSLVFPLTTAKVSSMEEAVNAVLAAAKAEGAQHIVVGMPYRMRPYGQAATGNMERDVLAFIEALKAKTSLTIDSEDERLTSALADTRRRMAGIKKKDFDRDAAAATATLESYIERMFTRPGVDWLSQ